MKLFKSLEFVTFYYFCFSVIECYTRFLNLCKVLKIDPNYHQITSFVSDNFTVKITDPKIFIHDFPNKIYSFDSHNKNFFHKLTKNGMKNRYSLQESLVIFFTNKLYESGKFLNFLIPQLSFRKRPKCLILYSSNNFNDMDEIHTMSIMKYAWKKKFLDFTVIQIINHLNVYTFHFNPFNDIVYKKDLSKNIKIFPDKLQNGYEYPLYISNGYQILDKIIRVKKSNHRDHLRFNPLKYLEYAVKSLNFKWTYKNVTAYKGGQVYFEKYNLDLVPAAWMDLRYDMSFVIPLELESWEFSAFIPLILISRVDIYLKIFYNVIIVLGIIFSFFYTLAYFQKASLERAKIFDNVRLLLGQSIAKEPEITSSRLIMLTVIVASIFIMNDLLSDIISLEFEKREMPFETHEDLYNSQIQTYIDGHNFTNNLIKGIENPHLSNILKKTLSVRRIGDCFKTLKEWQNVSCITVGEDPDWIISYYLNPDGSPTMKVAEPPLFSALHSYWFPNGSPYAMKFHKIMRRIKESRLTHWTNLIHKNERIFYANESSVTFDDSIKLEQLLYILSSGSIVSTVVFISEVIFFTRYFLIKNIKEAMTF